MVQSCMIAVSIAGMAMIQQQKQQLGWPQHLIFCLVFQWKGQFCRELATSSSRQNVYLEFSLGFIPSMNLEFRDFPSIYEQVAHKLVSRLIIWQQIPIDISSLHLKYKKGKYAQQRDYTNRIDHQGNKSINSYVKTQWGYTGQFRFSYTSFLP